MKYEISKDAEGRVNLQLGLSNSVLFAPECTLEDVVMGVNVLLEKVVGISTFELVTEVMNALQDKQGE